MRAALTEAIATFKAPDGSFVEEFQGTTFDARLLELYLPRLLLELGLQGKA